MCVLVKSVRGVLVGVVTIALGAVPSAEAAESGVRIFAGATWIAPLDDTRAQLDGETASVEAGSASGLEAGVEWRLGPRFGLEASLVRASLDVDFGSTRLGELDFEPILVSLNVHLVDNDRVDWWVAPTLFLFDWGEPALERGVELGDGSEEALGAGFGLDAALSDSWAFTAAVRYVDLQLRFGGGGEVAIDPLMVRAGLAWRPGSASGSRR